MQKATKDRRPIFLSKVSGSISGIAAVLSVVGIAPFHLLPRHVFAAGEYRIGAATAKFGDAHHVLWLPNDLGVIGKRLRQLVLLRLDIAASREAMAAWLAATSERGQVVENDVRCGAGLRPIKVYVGQISAVLTERNKNIMLIFSEIVCRVSQASIDFFSTTSPLSVPYHAGRGSRVSREMSSSQRGYRFQRLSMFR